MHLHKSEDEIDVERRKLLGKFCPLWKDGLQGIVADFLSSIASSDEGLGRKVAIGFIHAFLVPVFATVKLSPTESVDSILEQTALAFMINPSHGWKPPSAMISHIMRTTKNIARVVLIHSAFLGGYHEPYTSPTGAGSDDADDNNDEDEDSEGEDELDENGNAREFGTEPESHDVLNFDFMDLGHSTSEDGSQEEGPEESTETEKSKEILG
jgi:hypothetical protein